MPLGTRVGNGDPSRIASLGDGLAWVMNLLGAVAGEVEVPALGGRAC